MTIGTSTALRGVALALLVVCAGCAGSTLGKLQTEYTTLVREQARRSVPADKDPAALYPLEMDQAFAGLAERASDEVTRSHFSLLGLGQPDIRTRIAFARIAALAAISAGPRARSLGITAQTDGTNLCAKIPKGQFIPERDCALLEIFVPVALSHAALARSIDAIANSKGKAEIWCGAAPGAASVARDGSGQRLPEVVDVTAKDARNMAFQRCTNNYMTQVVQLYLGTRLAEGIVTENSALNRLLSRNIDDNSRRFYRGQAVRMLCVLKQVATKAFPPFGLREFSATVDKAAIDWAGAKEIRWNANDEENNKQLVKICAKLSAGAPTGG